MKPVLLLDIDETVAHTFNDLEQYRELMTTLEEKHREIFKRIYIIDFFDKIKGQTHMWGLIRPFWEEFRDTCSRYWELGLFTAGTRDYAQKMAKVLFPAGIPRLLFSREDCHIVDDDVIKPLGRLFQRHPEMLRGIRMEDILMVDNKYSNFSHNPQNGIVIADFAPEPTWEELARPDNELVEVYKILVERFSFAR